MTTNALLSALRRGSSSGTIGAVPVILNLTLLSLDACSWFMTVEPDTGVTIAVDLSFDAGVTWYPANPSTVTAYEEYNYSRSPGETYPTRVRLTRTAGTSSLSTYGLGPIVSQAVVAQGWYRQVVVNAPGRALQLSDIGAVLLFPGDSNSTLTIPADMSSLLGGRSYRVAGQQKWPAFAVFRQGNGQVQVVSELDSGNNPLVTILGTNLVSPNDRLLTLLMNISLNVWGMT